MQRARLYDAKRYHKTSLETYFALANVPKSHYGFKPPPNSIIHYPPFLRSLPLVNYYDRACFWSYKFSPFGIKQRKGRH